MTSTLSPNDTGDIRLGEGTRDLTYLTQRPALRRSDASGEFPLYQPKTIGNVDQMARLALEATLVHEVPLPPIDSLPEAVRRPAPTTHRAGPAVVPPPFADDPEMARTRKPWFGRGTHRPRPRVALSPGSCMSLGAGLLALAEVVCVAVLAVTR